MIKIPVGKIYNSYIIETSDFDEAKNKIMQFAISLGFDQNLVMTHNHPDIKIIESENNRFAIDDIREQIINDSYLTTKISDYKIYIICDSTYLDKNMQNTLLKTLEEPPKYDLFFLLATNSAKLLSTVKSRCIVIKDNCDVDTKTIYEYNYLDDAIKIMANIKYENAYDIMNFAKNATATENDFKLLIRAYRYILRDAFAYKKTLIKNVMLLKEKENLIIEVANAFTYKVLGDYINNLNVLSTYKGLAIDKSLAVYSFLKGNLCETK